MSPENKNGAFGAHILSNSQTKDEAAALKRFT